jgi:hypothetical protein
VGLVVSGAVILVPWHAWLLLHFGPAQMSASSPLALMKPDSSRGALYVLGSWLLAMGQNASTSLIPVPDFTTSQTPWGPGWGYLMATGFYFNLLTGALTLSLLLYLATVAWRGRREGERSPWPSLGPPAERNALWRFVLGGCVGALALHPGPSVHGLAHNACFASALVVVGLVWAVLARAPCGWFLAVTAGMLLEFLAMFWSHLAFTVDPDFLDRTQNNVNAKAEQGYEFLRDGLGGAALVVALLVAGVQLLYLVLLLRWRLRARKG